MLVLPETQRHLFRRPFGILYPSLDPVLPLLDGAVFFSVGDVVTDHLLRAGYFPDVAIIDGQTMRRPHTGVDVTDYLLIRVVNPPGCITPELTAAARRAVSDRRTVIQVEGEEDLAVLPLALVAPDRSLILYGQPGEGVVVLEISPGTREKAADLLDRFEEIPSQA